MGKKGALQYGLCDNIMYVELFQGNMYATERSPDIPGDVTWQWHEETISFKDWTYGDVAHKNGTADLAVTIT